MPTPTFESVTESDVMCRCETAFGWPDLYFPVVEGRRLQEGLPAVLLRTPYDKRSGAMLGRYYAGHGYVAALPGEVYELEFELFPTASRFARGHRIRVDISSSNYPRFERNLNTGEPLGTDRTRRTARNSLHHGRSTPSHVVLPVVASQGGDPTLRR